MRKAIRNLKSDKTTPPRFCDVIIEGNEVNLEIKKDKNRYETISWEDMKNQVDAAIKQAQTTNQKLPQIVP